MGWFNVKPAGYLETYYAWFKSPQGTFKVEVKAENISQAKAIFEGQYGAKNITGIHVK